MESLFGWVLKVYDYGIFLKNHFSATRLLGFNFETFEYSNYDYKTLKRILDNDLYKLYEL